jgi:hypothetical protein
MRGGLHERQAFWARFRAGRRYLLATLLAPPLLSPGLVRAEEGMWTFDAFPAATVERKLGVRLDQAWLDRLRAGSVRLTTGCSGALVSPRGLVATNQHCVLACLQALSDPEHDRLAEGFGVDAEASPRPCPGLQAEVLWGIADITAPVFKVSAGKTGDDFARARETLLARAERAACGGDSRFRCQAISFFGGGQFKIYKYRRYDDVRLVFAPEFHVAFFGGDPENFSFPRYDLDVAMLRLYERGAPAPTRAWLTWSPSPPVAGEAVFVSGSPGSTQRALTVAQLETLRDVDNPASEATYAALRDDLIAFGARGPAQRRLAAERLFIAQNALKLIAGQNAALKNPAFLAARREEERTLTAAVAADPKLAALVGDPWAEIAALQKAYARQFPVWRSLENGAGAGSRLFWYARTLVRAAEERCRPPGERLPEFADARLALVEKAVLDDQPVNAEIEAVALRVWLEAARSALGPDDPALRTFLDGEDPATLAARLAGGSRLGDPAVRAALWRGGLGAIRARDDALIAYVLKTDPLSRAARQVWEDDISGPIEEAAERVAVVRFAVRGARVYPDATFSPRISFGRVEGWRQNGAAVGPFTTLGGLYDHSGDAYPLKLPDRWRAARGRLNPRSILDFVTSNDIVGGNSGSPVVDARGQVVGAAFDGNQASIAGDFAYDGAVNRTVVVSTVAIDEALTKVYGRGDLVRELLGGVDFSF